MIYSKPVSRFYKAKTQNGLAKYPAKYSSEFYFEHYFILPVRQEMLYKEYWNVL